mmetsp:Transcript_39530/g.112096  ORF Transcript_39530/g.112096 Transcript_39530/m.112096 type:complete len:227 (+) Transcript_39530:1383-2063(+)
MMTLGVASRAAKTAMAWRFAEKDSRTTALDAQRQRSAGLLPARTSTGCTVCTMHQKRPVPKNKSRIRSCFRCPSHSLSLTTTLHRRKLTSYFSASRGPFKKQLGDSEWPDTWSLLKSVLHSKSDLTLLRLMWRLSSITMPMGSTSSPRCCVRTSSTCFLSQNTLAHKCQTSRCQHTTQTCHLLTSPMEVPTPLGTQHRQPSTPTTQETPPVSRMNTQEVVPWTVSV